MAERRCRPGPSRPSADGLPPHSGHKCAFQEGVFHPRLASGAAVSPAPSLLAAQTIDSSNSWHPPGEPRNDQTVTDSMLPCSAQIPIRQCWLSCPLPKQEPVYKQVLGAGLLCRIQCALGNTGSVDHVAKRAAGEEHRTVRRPATKSDHGPRHTINNSSRSVPSVSLW